MLSKHLAQSPNAVLVALDGGRPVGFCLLEFVAAKGAGGLAQLGVLPSARNRGAATALGMEAFRIFRERGLRYAQALTGPGENTEAARSFCHTLGLHREIPSVWLLGPI
jgi:GNAT superfamily N-acetyltransferase